MRIAVGADHAGFPLKNQVTGNRYQYSKFTIPPVGGMASSIFARWAAALSR